LDWKTKRIAHVSAVESTFTYVLYNQLKELRKQGMEIVCISTLEFPENLEILDKIGVKFIELHIERKMTPFSDLLSLYRLYKLFKREKFDLIHTQMPKSTLLGAMAGWLTNTPVINSARPLFTDFPPGLVRDFWIWIERISDYFTDLVMVENPLDYQNYLDLKVTTKEKLTIQGNGINLAPFDPEKVRPEDVQKLREELKIPGSAKVIGIVARDVYEKGFWELYVAFKELLSKYPELFLLSVILDLPSETGTVPGDLPEKMGIGHRVISLRNRRDMNVIFSLIDIFALPTYRDCFPKALIEAATMAKPIVTSDIPGCQAVVENEKSGLLIPVKDVKALTNALERLLKDPVFAKTLGANARKHALSDLDEQKVCPRILDCYKMLLDRSAGNASSHEGG